MISFPAFCLPCQADKENMAAKERKEHKRKSILILRSLRSFAAINRLQNF
jgi:hypothetical protein